MSKEVQKKKKLPPDLSPFYAAVDVGSNNVRMDLYGLDSAGAVVKIKITEQTVFPCKLAQEMSETNPVILRENLAAAVRAMSAFNAILSNYDIKPENTCTIMTAWARIVEGTEQGKKDIAELREAYGNRSYTIVTGKEEAILVGEAIKNACPKNWRNHRGKKASVAFAAIGGGSVELGVITPDGEIEDAKALPEGILVLDEQSHGRTQVAGKIFNRVLRKNYGKHKHKVLAVIGSQWRALGEAICRRHRLPAIIEGKKQIRATLVSATHRRASYYRSLGGRPEKRAEFMGMSAAMLRRVVKHFDARKLIVLEVTIRDEMARQMHALNTGLIKAPARGLERLFSPSGQEQFPLV